LAEAGGLELRLIEQGDRLTGLSTGHADFQPLKTFIQSKAKSFHQQNLARTYGLFEGPKIVGYLTLVCGEVDANGAGQAAPGFRYSHYPAIKIARLLIDARLRGQNWGAQLVDFAVGTAKDIICPAVGCRFVVVDAKKQSIGFYERCGFTLLDTDENRSRESPVMFLDLHKVAA
jgi:GNAT superfamily N-acetyltransferase